MPTEEAPNAPLSGEIVSAADDNAMVVVGAGPVGLAAALLAAKRLATTPKAGDVLLIAPPQLTGSKIRDHRTAAVFHDGCDMLREAGADEGLFRSSAELAGIRMIDISDRLLRAPDVTFMARDVGLETFGHNLANADIVSALEQAVDAAPGVRRILARVTQIAFDGAKGNNGSGTQARLDLDNGATVRTKAVIAADGRNSPLRHAAGISTRQWSRGQVAITSRFAHARAHNNISTELHDRGGPCTTVPLPGNRSSLVWMMREADVASAIGDAQTESGLQAALQSRVGSYLGAISDVVAPKTVALKSLVANRLAQRRVFLVGEAGHAFPPIGAQGLNLGFRDVADAVDLVVGAIRAGEDPGADRVTARYHTKRWPDVEARSQGVDILNESLIATGPLLPLARGAGLHAVSAIGPLRRLLMSHGMAGVSLPDPVGFMSVTTKRVARAAGR
ncbi:MAG: FAD-dependent monooxygenase [Pseudomonadota bacterium]